MKSLYLLILIFIELIFSGCTSINYAPATTQYSPPQDIVIQTTEDKNYSKNPLAVTVYTKGERPHHPFKVVGKEVVAEFNAGGIKRQEATLKDLLRNQAAMIGGDGVIIVKHDDKTITGAVICYQDAAHDADMAV